MSSEAVGAILWLAMFTLPFASVRLVRRLNGSPAKVSRNRRVPKNMEEIEQEWALLDDLDG